MKGLALFVMVFGYLVFLLSSATAEAAGRYSAQFCIRDHRSYRFLNLMRTGTSAMKFGFSEWARNNITVYGVAHRIGPRAWRFVDIDSPDPAERCQVDLRVDEARRTAEIWGDSTYACAADGGVGTEVDHLYFPATSYKGRVSNQLASPSRFFNSGGPC